MGQIRITTVGSFGKSEKVFSAEQHGHAHAVNEALNYLNIIMHASINSDHALLSGGQSPKKGFIKTEFKND